MIGGVFLEVSSQRREDPVKKNDTYPIEGEGEEGKKNKNQKQTELVDRKIRLFIEYYLNETLTLAAIILIMLGRKCFIFISIHIKIAKR